MLEKQPRNITSSSLSSSVKSTLRFARSSRRGEPLNVIRDSSCRGDVLTKDLATSLGQLALTGEFLLTATTFDGSRSRDTTGIVLVGVFLRVNGGFLSGSFSLIAEKINCKSIKAGVLIFFFFYLIQSCPIFLFFPFTGRWWLAGRFLVQLSKCQPRLAEEVSLCSLSLKKSFSSVSQDRTELERELKIWFHD